MAANRPTAAAVLQAADFVEDSLATKLASAFAPAIYFDVVTGVGASPDGIAFLTLEMVRHTLPPAGPVIDSVAVAHLRCSLETARQLRNALNSVLGVLDRPTDGGAKAN